MNSYQYAQLAGVTGTDEEVVSQLGASGVTAQPIDLTYLLELLNFRNMLRKTDGNSGDERWKGTLQNLKSALIDLELTDKATAYEMWFSHITNPRQSRWDTTQPSFAAPFWEMRLAFSDQPGMPTSEDFAAVAALGGGWLFADLTVEQFESDRTAYELEQQAAEADRLAEESARINHARKQQVYSALVDASRWVESLDQCPTQAEVIGHITPNLPSEE